jgi:hypothetical protein
MPPEFLTALFWIAAVAVVVAQWMILRSTGRAWGLAGGPVPLTERVFAYGPALVILAVLYFSWQAATAPPVMQVEFVPAAASTPL